MIDRAYVTGWLNRYVQAWQSYEVDAIKALFSADATYLYNPWDTEPVRGRDAIALNWIENRDEPGSWQASYTPVAVEGNTAVAQGRTIYFEADKKTPRRQFDNIFVMRFNDQGECTEFTEWFMQPRRS